MSVLDNTNELTDAAIDSIVAGVEGGVGSAPGVGNCSASDGRGVEVAEYEHSCRTRTETSANPARLFRGHDDYQIGHA